MNENERYQEVATTLARLLHGQTIFIDSVKLVVAGNAVNAMALWDISTDWQIVRCGLQNLMLALKPAAICCLI
jgi:hypothetical protein